MGLQRVVVALLLGACVSSHQDPPAWTSAQLADLLRHTTWHPPANVHLAEAPNSTARSLWAITVNVGDIKVVEGNSDTVSMVSNASGNGYGLRMDAGRQDLARITQQVLAEEGDHFDFLVVFPAFEDLLNPGLAYFSLVSNAQSGLGMEVLDLTHGFGSAGRLQGFINMNRPQAYTALDGLGVEDPRSLAYPIMGQEMTHRWLAYALFAKPEFNEGRPSNALLGRDQSHWSALMHTGPANPLEANPWVSVQDGVSWLDNGNDTFTAVDVFADPLFHVSPRARFSPLDLYLMGFQTAAEVSPFFIINNARYAGQYVPASARIPMSATVTGTRMDISMENILAALGPRVPNMEQSQKDFTMGVVVLTAPGQHAADVSLQVAQVDAFRLQWEDRFHDWTLGRASLCTSLSGQCQRAHLQLQGLTSQPVTPGVIIPGETFTLSAVVENTGVNASQAASVAVEVEGGLGTASPTTQLLGAVAAGARIPLTFQITPAVDFPCGQHLRVRLVLTASLSNAVTASWEEAVGIQPLARWTMEDVTGWTVNPDGLDTATGGQWAVGDPRPTNLGILGYTNVMFQPAGDSPDDGRNAFVTDPGSSTLMPDAWDDTDVDHGFTTLESPLIDLGGWRHPRLEFMVWHVARVVDLVNARVDNAQGDDLTTKVSVDDGPFVDVQVTSSPSSAWTAVAVDLWAVPFLRMDGARHAKVRFVAGDDGVTQATVEAGVDDVRVSAWARECVAAASSRPATLSGASGEPPQGSSSAAAWGPPRQDPVGLKCVCTQAAPRGLAVGMLLLGVAARGRKRSS